MPKHYYHIMTNHTRMLYIGMTDNIGRRPFAHKTGYFEASFTDRYQIGMLVYFEELPDAIAAARREKQLKGWTRKKKMTLVEISNPKWIDLAERWFTSEELESGILHNLDALSSTFTTFLPTSASPAFRQDPSTAASTPSLRI